MWQPVTIPSHKTVSKSKTTKCYYRHLKEENKETNSLANPSERLQLTRSWKAGQLFLSPPRFSYRLIMRKTRPDTKKWERKEKRKKPKLLCVWWGRGVVSRGKGAWPEGVWIAVSRALPRLQDFASLSQGRPPMPLPACFSAAAVLREPPW